MRKRYRLLTYVMTLCLSLTLLSPVCSAAESAAAGAEGGLAATVITGVPNKISRSASAKASVTVSVSPARGTRTVQLQQYDKNGDRWITRSTKKTSDKAKASVTLGFAKKYRKKTTGQWRIVVNPSDTAQGAVSRTIRVTSRNIKNLKLSTQSACIYCIDTGEFIYMKKAGTRRSPASTTKLMTSILLAESGKLSGVMKISRNAAKTPYTYGKLKAGDTYRTVDLLYAMLLPSANDAAVAAAEGVSGSTSAFVKKMNRKARRIGLKNTHFKNPVGFNAKGHYTTAKDLARLTAYAYEIEPIRDAMKTKSKKIRSLRYHRTWRLHSSNSLLGKISSLIGGKTGTGSDAKYCFTGLYQHKGKTYVTVVLRAKSDAGRWSSTKKLHSYIRKYGNTGY